MSGVFEIAALLDNQHEFYILPNVVFHKILSNHRTIGSNAGVFI